MAYKEQKFKTYKTEKDGVTLKKGKDGFPEYTLAQKRALNVFNREFKKCWEESRILCTQRERDCQESYHESAFFKFTGIDKETFHDGNDYQIGNDERYYLFNEIHELGLPLEEVLAVNPSLEERSLIYYYIYKDTIVVTYGFFDVLLLPDLKKHRVAIRDYDRRPDLYGDDEMAGINTHPYICEFRKTYWEKHIRPEHKHLPLKILYTKRSYRSLNMVTDKFDSHVDGIFYKRLEDLKRIFTR